MTTSGPPQIWSSSDFPYMCLKDERRTRAFGDAIAHTVTPGDVVVDVGAGSGILSLFAASAGASRVYAVEVDHSLAAALRDTVALNGLDDVVTVVEGDVLDADLPVGADVVVAEIIDTGLLDELQVPVLNRLRERGVVAADTRLVPSRYRTEIQLVRTDNLYYGYRIVAPKHLSEGVTLGATNALNGDKIIPLHSELTGEVRLELTYRLGGGLGSLAIRRR